MEFVIKIAQFLLSLSLLIVLHELGHFIPAKLFKTRVEKFYLFFDVKFSLFKKKVGETVYGIGWLPLGGYVKIAGMIDESMDTEQMQQEPQPWEFRSKPAWQRLIIMLGGVTVNFILAFVIYIGMASYYGDRYIANNSLKDGVWVTSQALQDAGLQNGDKIISIDNKPLERLNEAPAQIITAKEIAVERNGAQEVVTMPVDFVSQLLDTERTSLLAPRMPIIVAQVPDDSKNIGVLEEGDFIVEINHQPVVYFDQLEGVLDPLKGETVPGKVKRNDEVIDVNLTINDEAKLGFVTGQISEKDAEKLGLFTLETQKYNLVEAIPVGLEKGKNQLTGYWKQLKMIVNPDTGAYKAVGGFKAIYDVFPQTWSWEVFWGITALLSIMLGVMNLLPIPALDGGHVMFLLYEIITGKKPSDKFMEYAQTVGFFILIALLLFANGNDIYRAIFK